MNWNLAGAVILSGAVIVFLILIILILVVTVTGRIMNREKEKPQPQASPPAAPATAPKSAPAPMPVPKVPNVQAGIGEETVAVIAAAVAAVMDEESPGAAYAVTEIKRQRGERPVWGFAGMQQNTRPF